MLSYEIEIPHSEEARTQISHKDMWKRKYDARVQKDLPGMIEIVVNWRN